MFCTFNIKLIIRNYYKYNNNTQTFQYHCNNCPLLLDLMGIVQSKLVYLKKKSIIMELEKIASNNKL